MQLGIVVPSLRTLATPRRPKPCPLDLCPLSAPAAAYCGPPKLSLPCHPATPLPCLCVLWTSGRHPDSCIPASVSLPYLASAHSGPVVTTRTLTSLPHRLWCAVVYRMGQKRLIRAHLVGGREELQRIVGLLAKVQEAARPLKA